MGCERGLQQEVTAHQVADRAGTVRNLHIRNRSKAFPSRSNSLWQEQKCGEACQVQRMVNSLRFLEEKGEMQKTREDK